MFAKEDTGFLMKKAFYGGTFDPPHSGHVHLGRAVLENGSADEVMYVPAWHPPHKRNAEIAPYDDRLAMLKLAIRGEPGFSVSEIERDRGGISFTIDTLRLLSDRCPEDEFFLLIGSDSLLQLHQWHRAHELVSEFGVLCYPRPGDEVTVERLLSVGWSREEADTLRKGIMTNLPRFDISSTAIREMLRRGEYPEDQLNRNVWNYIKTRRLYES